jgi:uncharacterized protein
VFLIDAGTLLRGFKSCQTHLAIQICVLVISQSALCQCKLEPLNELKAMAFDQLQQFAEQCSQWQTSSSTPEKWLSPTFMLLVLIGFAAQLVDGAIGMAYGITSASLLLMLGISPQMASASVHAAEIATTGVSGISHGLLGNVNAKLVMSLALPGVLGGIVGATLLARISTAWLKPLVSIYLLGLGALLLVRALRFAPTQKPSATGPSLGLSAGFLDAVGGGGWGALTTGSLLAKNYEPRIAIGSANAAEFFVTLAIAGVLFANFGLSYLPLVAGLVIGGVLAAPLAALLSKKIPARAAMAAVGSGVIILSLVNVGKWL